VSAPGNLPIGDGAQQGDVLRRPAWPAVAEDEVPDQPQLKTAPAPLIAFLVSPLPRVRLSSR
jgi:hypothetical protein